MQWFDVLVLVILSVTLFLGFMIGFIRQAGLIAAIFCGAFFAGQAATLIYPQLSDLLSGTSPAIVSVLSYIIAFFAIFIVVMIIAMALQSLIKTIRLNPLNRIAGAIFCSAVWIFVFSICMNIVVELDKNKTLVGQDVREISISYPFVRSFAYQIVPYLRFNHLNEGNSSKEHKPLHEKGA